MAVSNVLKDPASLYSPGERSPAWLKLEPTLDVTVTGRSDQRIASGDWGEAVMLELAYKHPRTGKRTDQAGRPHPSPSALPVEGGRPGVAGLLGCDAEWDAAAPIVSESDLGSARSNAGASEPVSPLAHPAAFA